MFQKGFTKIFIAYVIVGLVILGGAYYAVKNRPVTELQPPVTTNDIAEPGSVVHDVPTDETTDWKIYKEAREVASQSVELEFKYPDFLIVSFPGDRFVFEHSVAYKHADPCDLRTGTTTLESIVDFNASMQILETNLKNSIQTAQPHLNISEIFDINGGIKLQQNYLEQYQAGNLNGYVEIEGAEGCGVKTYYFPLKSNTTLAVTQSFSPERTPLIGNYLEVLALPGIISPEEEEKLFSQILSTFKFISN